MTSHSAASNATSQNAIQCRPLRGTGDLKDAELCRPRARVRGNLLRIGNDGLLGQDATERAPATGAYRLPRRANAVAGPLAERVLDDAILARVVRDDAQLAAGLERVAQLRQRGGERIELFVDRDPQRLKQSREVRGTGPRSQDPANRIDEIVADRKRRVEPAPHDFSGERSTTPLVTVFREHRAEPLDWPGIEDVSRGNPPPPSVCPLPSSPHAHIQRRARAERETALVGVDLVRADAEVEDDAIRTERLNGGKGGRGGEGCFEVLHGGGGQAAPRGGNRGGVR